MDISLILPAFNEAATIVRTVQEVASHFEACNYSYELIVAADGEDGTREKARELASSLPVKVIGDSARRGKGRGIREGVAIASGRTIGFADADNKVPITEYDLIAPWLASGSDVVIGSRAFQKSKIEKPQPIYRRLGAKGFGFFMQAVVGVPGIRDTQCGFKFFRHHIAKDLFRRQTVDGYMFDVEVLGLAQRLGYSIKQVPVRWRDDADSRLQLVSGNIRNVIDIFKIKSSLNQLARLRFETGPEIVPPAQETGHLVVAASALKSDTKA